MQTRITNVEGMSLDSDGVWDLDASLVDDELRKAILNCIEIQKESAREAMALFKPSDQSAYEVSEARLQQIIASDNDIHGISSNRNISNVIAFSAPHLSDAVRDHAVEKARRAVDKKVSALLKKLFRDAAGYAVTSSGHLWYPPGSYMGWHTNSKVPGWRIYINYAEQEGASFFRYRDPDTLEIVTLPDKRWNIRLFRISREKPLWHAVYSDTNRFSMGYMVYRPKPFERVRRVLRRLTGHNKQVFRVGS